MAKDTVGLTVKKADDFSEWYTQLLTECELADIRYNVKGLVVYQPWATKSIRKMYQKMQKILDMKGHEELIMPTLIPESNFTLESSHVAGFTPEVFWVTHGGDTELEEKLALRPTSETAFYQMYALWIRSHNDLPFKKYQAGSVFRYEGKATRPFFRSREIHWIETHCAHATHEDALAQVKQDMETTEEFLLHELAMPFIFFERPEWDKFAGAVKTFAADVLMGSGRVLQQPSTHLLGTNFSKPFNVKYNDKNGVEQFVHITCYGPAISRIYGGMISYLGDDKGLVLPFDIAPAQIVIVPLIFKGSEEKVIAEAKKIKEIFENKYDVLIDQSDKTPGWKYNFWEMKGVPVRISIGPKDLEKNQVEISRRDTNTKEFVSMDKLKDYIENIHKTFTKHLVEQAKKVFEGNIVNAENEADLKKAIEENKMARVGFCSVDKSGEECAKMIETNLSAYVRGKKAFADEKAKGKCVVCGKPAKEVVYVARSY